MYDTECQKSILLFILRNVKYIYVQSHFLFLFLPLLSPSHLTPTSLSPLHLFSSIIASDEEEPTSAGMKFLCYKNYSYLKTFNRDVFVQVSTQETWHSLYFIIISWIHYTFRLNDIIYEFKVKQKIIKNELSQKS